MKKTITRFLLIGILSLTFAVKFPAMDLQSECEAQLTTCIASSFNISGCQERYRTCMRGTPPKIPPFIPNPNYPRNNIDESESLLDWIVDFFDL